MGLVFDTTQALTRALERNRTLTALDLGQNKADGDAIAGPLSTMLRRNVSLRTLDLRYAGMTDAGAVVLALALAHNASLELLDARCCAVCPNPDAHPTPPLTLTLTLP